MRILFHALALVATFLLPMLRSEFSVKPVESASSTSAIGTWECWDDGSVDPCHRSLWGVSMLSATDGWAVGDAGAILHWTGAAWSQVPAPVNVSMSAIDMVSGTDGWAVGDGGTILHWDGAQWSQVTSPVSQALSGIHMLSSLDGWAVGHQGVTIHWDGVSWVDVPNSSAAYLESVDMVSGNDVWAVGDDVFLHWNGAAWIEMLSPNNNVWLEDVDMVSASDGWAVGSDYHIFRWNGSNWSVWLAAYPSNGSLYDVSIASPTDGWAVGDFGAIMHWNGANWEYTTGLDGSRPTYYAVDYTIASAGWIVGSGSAVLHNSGSGWSDFNLPSTAQLNDVDFVSDVDGWGVGNEGLIMQWDGATWSQFASPASVDLNALAMVASDNGWIVGDDGTILHWNGVNWSLSPSPITDKLESISMVSITDGWAVGSGDYFLRWNGAAWTTTASPNNLPFHSVDFLNANEGWAVGGVFIGPPNLLSGYIYHWDGAQWSRVNSPIQTQYLYSVNVFDATHVWIGGDQWDSTNQSLKNVMMLYDGADLSEVYAIDTIPSGLFQDISSPGLSDVWVVGDYGTISYWDGITWAQVDSPTESHLTAAAMLNTDDGWAVGSNGIILRYFPPPSLSINYATGAPGSFFTVTGSHFPAKTDLEVSVNGYSFGQVQSDSSGGFTFLLDTGSADEGVYVVYVEFNPTFTTRFHLDAAEPVRPQDGSGTIYQIPSGLAFTHAIYLPMIQQ